MRPFPICCIALAICLPSLAASSGYDPRVTFAPLTLPQPVNVYRSADGAPGPSYWQNRADYTIRAQLDTAKKEIRGDETITYTNNSPDRLPYVWIHLEQNMYKADSRSNRLGMDRPAEPMGATDGFVREAVEIESGTTRAKADYIVSDSRMQIRLVKTIPPHGGVIRIHIHYHYQIPGKWGGRTSWRVSAHGDIYDIAQWYPRMCVYDDLHGWDTLPYIGSEFYLEYGNFDYYITAPASLLIVGSGELVNPAQALTREESRRLTAAPNSDSTVVIRSQEEALAAETHAASGLKTWHFRMANTRDVSWSASAAFIGTQRAFACLMARRPWRSRLTHLKAKVRMHGANPPSM